MREQARNHLWPLRQGELPVHYSQLLFRANMLSD